MLSPPPEYRVADYGENKRFSSVFMPLNYLGNVHGGLDKKKGLECEFHEKLEGQIKKAHRSIIDKAVCVRRTTLPAREVLCH